MKNKKSFHLFLLYIILGILFIQGCVSLPTEDEVAIEHDVPSSERERVGIYHKVNRGETIWRIAKAYNVAIAEIIETNNIPDVAQVEENQLIFIPGAESVKEIVIEVEPGDEDFEWPIKGRVLHYFNSRDNRRLNKGIDIKAQEGDVVKASRSGNVVFCDYLTGYGDTIVVDHLDGYYSVYAQNAELLVNLDDNVRQSQPIARLGRKKNEEAYLHFEIRHHALEENPLFYLP